MYKINLDNREHAFIGIAKKSILLIAMLVVTLSVSAQSKSVTMPEVTTTISDAFKSIQAQVGYKFTWDRQFDVNRNVTLPTSTTPFTKIMEIILEGSDRTYSIYKHYILIKEPAALEVQPDRPEPIPTPKSEIIVQTLRGRIILEKEAKPIYNAVVSLTSGNGAPFVTTTDTKGEFSIVRVPNGSYKLEVSHLDYGSTDMNVNVGDGTILNLEVVMPIALNLVLESEHKVTPNRIAVSTKSLLGRPVPTIKQKMPVVAIKTNIIHDIIPAVNLGVEVRLSKSMTLDIPFTVNQWKGESRKNILMVQPELRWWTTEPFNGHFFGVHAHYAHFGVGNVDFPLDIWNAAKDYHFQGDLYGIGFSYGYQWILANRLNLEANIGLGYFYAKYDKFDCAPCNAKIETGSKKHYFGPTKLGISLIYILK